MRRNIWFVLISILLPTFAWAVESDVQTHYYSVRGNTLSEIYESFEEAKNGLGLQANVGSEPSFSWKWKYKKEPGACSVARALVVVKINHYFPKHESLNTLPNDVRAAWQKKKSEMSKHMYEQVDISMVLAHDLERKLYRIKPKKNCEAVAKEIGSLGDAMLEELDNKIEAYAAERREKYRRERED